jgi:hypothetical protein
LRTFSRLKWLFSVRRNTQRLCRSRTMASAQLEEWGQAAPYGPRTSTAAPNVRPDCTGRGCRARRVGGRPAPVSDGGRSFWVKSYDLWQSEARPRRSIGSSSARAIDFKGLYAKEQSAQSLNTLVGTNSSNALTTSRTARYGRFCRHPVRNNSSARSDPFS